MVGVARLPRGQQRGPPSQEEVSEWLGACLWRQASLRGGAGGHGRGCESLGLTHHHHFLRLLCRVTPAPLGLPAFLAQWGCR